MALSTALRTALSAASFGSRGRGRRSVRRRDPAQRGTPTKKGETLNPIPSRRCRAPGARVHDLHAQQAEISLQTPDEAAQALTAAELAAVADHLETVTAEANPQKAKALLRLLIHELRVNSRTEILPTYRLATPEVCAMSEKVEAAGIEPAFSSRGE